MSALKAIAAVGILIATTLSASAGAPPSRLSLLKGILLLHQELQQNEQDIQNLKKQMEEVQEQQQEPDEFTQREISAVQGRVDYLCQVLVRTGCP